MYYANSMDMLVDGEVQTVPILDTTKAPAIIETASGETVSIQDSAVAPFSGLKLFGKATQDGTPSPENEVPIDISGSGGVINTFLYGANLFDYNLISAKGFVSKCSVQVSNDEISVTITQDGNAYFGGLIQTNVGTEYTGNKDLLFPVTPNKNLNIFPSNSYFNDAYTCYLDGDYKIIAFSSGFVQTIPQGAVYATVRIGNSNAKVSDGTNKTTLLVTMGNSNVFVSFQTPQQLSISTPNGLPGIQVTSGGNYTDATGQQWISDVIDLEAGTYTQNCAEIVFDGSEDENWQLYSSGAQGGFSFYIQIANSKAGYQTSLCNRFKNTPGAFDSSKYGLYTDHPTLGLKYFRQPNEEVQTIEQWRSWLQQNPTTLLYAIDAFVVTQISPEEIAAYKALLSNYPSTNIFTDSTPQAGIEASYTADTKTYIDNKISQAVAIAKA